MAGRMSVDADGYTWYSKKTKLGMLDRPSRMTTD